MFICGHKAQIYFMRHRNSFKNAATEPKCKRPQYQFRSQGMDGHKTEQGASVKCIAKSDRQLFGSVIARPNIRGSPTVIWNTNLYRSTIKREKKKTMHSIFCKRFQMWRSQTLNWISSNWARTEWSVRWTNSTFWLDGPTSSSYIFGSDI